MRDKGSSLIYFKMREKEQTFKMTENLDNDFSKL